MVFGDYNPQKYSIFGDYDKKDTFRDYPKSVFQGKSYPLIRA
jgi:hypothetical protein